MARYALFLFFENGPCGGLNDLALVGSLDECVARAEQADRDMAAQVVALDHIGAPIAVVRYGGWVYTPRHMVTGLTADMGKIDWHYQWAERAECLAPQSLRPEEGE